MAAPGTRISVAIASPYSNGMVAADAVVIYTVHRSASRRMGLAVRWLEVTPPLRLLLKAAAAQVEQVRLDLHVTPRGPHGEATPAASARTAPYRAAPPMHVELPITRRERDGD